jgi:hypothetical protein
VVDKTVNIPRQATGFCRRAAGIAEGIASAFDGCLRGSITDGRGGAIAGRPLSMRFLDRARTHSLRFKAGKRVHNADELMSTSVTTRSVEHLERSGFVIMKRPPIGGGAALGALLRGVTIAVSLWAPRLPICASWCLRLYEVLRGVLRRSDACIGLGDLEVDPPFATLPKKPSNSRFAWGLFIRLEKHPAELAMSPRNR